VAEGEEDKPRITTGPECTVELVQVAVLYEAMDRSLEQEQEKQGGNSSSCQPLKKNHPPTTSATTKQKKQKQKRCRLNDGSNLCLRSNRYTYLQSTIINVRFIQ